MDSLIVFAAVFVVYVYIIAPIQMKARMSMSADPEFEEVEADDERLPEAAEAFYCDVAAQLAPLGFQPAAYLISRETIPNATGYVAVFEHRAARDLAAATAAFVQATPTRISRSYAVEFSSDLSDGIEINTNNSTASQWRASPPLRKMWQFPAMADLARLYQLHQALTACRRPATKRAVPPRGEHAAVVRTSLIKDSQAQVAAGHMCLDSSGARFRFTWKGGMLGAWSQLWPISTIRRWSAARRARAILRELNLSTKYDTVDYRKRFSQYSATPREELAAPTFAPPESRRATASDVRCPTCGDLIVTAQPAGTLALCPTCHRAVPVSGLDAPIRVRHSGLGIASFALAVVSGLTEFLSIAIVDTQAIAPQDGTDEDSFALPALVLVFMGGIALALVGLALGIGGLAQKNRKKLFAILGLCGNGFVLLCIGALMLLGSMLS